MLEAASGLACGRSQDRVRECLQRELRECFEKREERRAYRHRMPGGDFGNLAVNAPDGDQVALPSVALLSIGAALSK